jgi:hypothetical protein
VAGSGPGPDYVPTRGETGCGDAGAAGVGERGTPRAGEPPDPARRPPMTPQPDLESIRRTLDSYHDATDPGTRLLLWMQLEVLRADCAHEHLSLLHPAGVWQCDTCLIGIRGVLSKAATRL